MIHTNIVLFSVIDTCNAQCKTCSFWKTKTATYPPKEKIPKIIRTIRDDLGCGILVITGGEPMLYPHTFDIIKAAKKSGITVHLTTNGSLLDKKTIKKLENCGLDLIAFSVDHFDESIVNANRRIPSLLHKLKDNMHWLKKTDIVTQAGITIAKHNINHLERTAAYALDVLKVDEIYFCTPMQLTQSTFKLGNTDNDSISFPDNQLADTMADLQKLKRRLGIRIAHKLRFLKEMESFYLGKKQAVPCMGGAHIFYLDNHLDVYRCMYKNEKLGSIDSGVHPVQGNCFECPIQCFREPSLFYQGFRSIPYYVSQACNPHYRKIVKKKLITKYVRCRDT